MNNDLIEDHERLLDLVDRVSEIMFGLCIAEAMALVNEQVGKHPTYVFSFSGKPIKQLSTKAWYKALERADIRDFCWITTR